MRVMKAWIDRGEGRPLAADLHTTSAPVGSVLVVHGFKGFKDWGFFPFLCDRMADAGLAALRVNLSGCGIRGGGDRFDDPVAFERQTIESDLRDVAEACRFLRGRMRGAGTAPIPLGLFGHSRGGAAALIHAAEDRSIASLATWSSIAGWDRYGPEAVAAWKRGESVPVANARTGQILPLGAGFWNDLEANRNRYDLIARAAELDRPWLIVHGDQDETVPVEEARELHRAARGPASGGRVRLHEVHGAGHTFGAVHPFEGAPPPLLEATRETVEWFRGTLRSP